MSLNLKTFDPNRLTDDQLKRAYEELVQTNQLSPELEQELVESQEEVGALEAGIDYAKANLSQGLAPFAGLFSEAAEQASIDYADELREQTERRYERGVPSIIDAFSEEGVIGGLAKTPEYLYETLAFSAPQLVSAFGAGALGSLAGGPGVGVATGLAVGLPFYAGANIKEQMEQGTAYDDVGFTKAYVAAVGQAGLDLILGKTLGIFGRSRGLEEIAKTADRGFKKRVAVGVAKGAAIEAPTEALQTTIEILQSKPEFVFELDDQERKEVLESAIAGGLLGGAITGTVGGIRNEGRAAQQKIDSKEADLQAEMAFQKRQTEARQENVDESFKVDEDFEELRKKREKAESEARARAEKEAEEKARAKAREEAEEKARAEAEEKARKDKTQQDDTRQKEGTQQEKGTQQEEGTRKKEYTKSKDEQRDDQYYAGKGDAGDQDFYDYNPYPPGYDKRYPNGETQEQFKARVARQKAEKRKQKARDREYAKAQQREADRKSAEGFSPSRTYRYSDLEFQRDIDDLENGDSLFTGFKFSKKKGKAKDQENNTQEDKADATKESVYNAKNFQFKKSFADSLNNVQAKLNESLAAFGLADKINLREILRADVFEGVEIGRDASFEGFFSTEKVDSGKMSIALATRIYQNKSIKKLLDKEGKTKEKIAQDVKLAEAFLLKELSGVMNHEIIHAIKELGVLNNKEYQILVNAAKNRKYVDYFGKRRSFSFLERAEKMYPKESSVNQEEEAVAELFRGWASGQVSMAGKPLTMMNKIFNFIKTLGGVLESEKLKASDIFESIKSGEVGRRGQTGTDSSDGGIKFSRILRENSPTNLQKYIKDNPEGFTIRAEDFSEVSGGYSVAPLKQAEIIVGQNIPEKTLIDFLIDNKNLASAVDNPVYLGGWFDSRTNQYYLDNSLILQNKNDALYIAEIANQEAIFDLNIFEEIRTKDGIKSIRESGSYSNNRRDRYKRGLEEVGKRFDEARNQRSAIERAEFIRRREQGRDAPRFGSRKNVRFSRLASENPFDIDLGRTVLDNYPQRKTISKKIKGVVQDVVVNVFPDNPRTPNKTNLIEAVKLLKQNYINSTGTEDPVPYIDENIDSLARIMATESLKALEQDENAIGWYDSKVKGMKAVLRLTRPEAFSSPENETIFMAALAITSNGQDVFSNYQYANEVFDYYLNPNNSLTDEDGNVINQLPVDDFKKGGDNQKAMRDSFKFINQWNMLTNKKRAIPLQELLSKDFTVKKLQQTVNNINANYGTDIKVPSDELANTAVKGSYIFGPKVGQGFYQNLIGNYDPLTTDIWWMRMWNRYVGNPLQRERTPKEMREKRNAIKDRLRSASKRVTEEDILIDNLFRDALKKTGLLRKDIQRNDSFDEFNHALNLSWERYFRDFQKINNGNNPEKPQLFKDSKTFTTYVKPGLREAPGNGSERAFIRKVVERAKELLKQEGVDIQTADLQALLWYPEKRLFEAMGVRKGKGQEGDFQSAAIKGAIDNGITEQRIEQALRNSGAEGGKFSRIGGEPRQSGSDGRVYDSTVGDVGTRFSRTSPNYEEIIETFTSSQEPEGLFSKFMRSLVGAVGGESYRQAFVRNTVNRFLPGFTLDAMAYGDLSGDMLSRSVGKAMELSQQLAGRTQALVELGALQIDRNTGEITLIDSVDNIGLQQIFEPIGTSKQKEYQAYAASKRELALRNKGRQGFTNIEDKQSLIDFVSEAEIKNPEFLEVYNNYQNFNNKMIQLAVDAQVIDPQFAEELSDMSYVPFYRQVNEDLETIEKESTGPNVGSLNAQVKVFKQKLKGGEVPLGDFYENIIKNNQAILSSALRNIALQKTVDALETMTGRGDNSWGEKLGPKAKGSNIMRVRKNVPKNKKGKIVKDSNGNIVYENITENWKIKDPALWISIANLKPQQLNSVVKALSVFSNILRQGVTLQPAFMIANLWRGKIDANVKAGVSLNPATTASGLMDSYFNRSDAIRLKTLTGLGGYTYGMDETAFSDVMKRKFRVEKGEYKVGAGSIFRRSADLLMTGKGKLEEVGEATEMAERIALFKQLKDQGFGEREAAYQAMNLINFGRRGSGGGLVPGLIDGLIPMVPFLNARIQGLYRLIENPKTPADIKLRLTKEVALRGAVLGAISTSIYAVMAGDERWEQETLDRKVNYDILYVGDTTVYLPRAFEVGAIFSSMPMLIGEQLRGQSDLAPGTFSILMNTFAFNPWPQGALPIIEASTNKDFFTGRPIEGLSLSRKLVKDRYYDSTSQVYISASSLLEDIGLAESTGLSPLKIQQLFEGYTGSIGASFIGMIDSFIGMSGAVPERPSGFFGDPYGTGAIASTLGINRFLKDDSEKVNRFVSEFYEMKRNIDQANTAIKDAASVNDSDEIKRLLEKSGEGLAYRKYFDRVARQMTDINKRISMVMKDKNMSSSVKQEELEKLKKIKGNLAEQMVKAGKKAGL